MATSQQPEQTFRIGLVSAAVFCHTVEAGEGKRRDAKDIRSVALQRRYKDTDGEWKSSTSFGLPELPQALEVIRMALDYVRAKEACGA
jgi:hypothetical protein